MKNSGLVLFKDSHVSYIYPSMMDGIDQFEKKYHVRNLWWEKQILDQAPEYKIEADFQQFLVPHLRIIVIAPRENYTNFQIHLPFNEFESLQDQNQVKLQKGSVFIHDENHTNIYVFHDWYNYQSPCRFDTNNLKWYKIKEFDEEKKIKPTGGFIDKTQNYLYLFCDSNKQNAIQKYSIQADTWQSLNTNMDILKGTVFLPMWKHNLNLPVIQNDEILIFHYEQKDVFKFSETTNKFTLIEEKERFGSDMKSLHVDVFTRFEIKPQIFGKNLYIVIDEDINIIDLSTWKKKIRMKCGYKYA